MSSFVYFKFKSQKDPTRVTIDGPHTDVWTLKREIITLSRLGDGTDFDLKIYKENSDEEYTDDTEIIPRDSTVLARRLPASAPGKGRAARYVSGKPPASAKPSATTTRVNAAAMMDSNMTEEEKIKAMLKMTDAQWQQQQEDMSHDARIGIAGQSKSRNVKIPEGEPPHGYVCYRCKKKGHWIQACPTNDDASFDGRPRTKRTTGIPQSRLRKIDESEIDKLDESSKQNLMVNADGDYVLAQSDEKAWKKFQEQQNATGEAQKTAQAGNKELQDRGLQCPIDKRMFVDPMRTPCCGKTYCHECIENALLDNDLECPGCQTPNVSLERLEPDEDAKSRIKEYETEKRSSRSVTASAAGSPIPGHSSPVNRATSGSPKSPSSIVGRKRGVSELSSNALTAPAMKRQRSEEPVNDADSSLTQVQQHQPQQSSEQPSIVQTPNNALPDMMSLPNMNMPFNPMMNPFMMGMMGMPGMMPNMPNMQMPMPNMNMNMNMNGFVPPSNFPAMNNMNNNNYYNKHTNGHQGNNWGNNRGGARPNGWRPKNQPRFHPYGNSNGNNNSNQSTALQSAPVKDVPNAPKGPKAMQTTAAPTGPRR